LNTGMISLANLPSFGRATAFQHDRSRSSDYPAYAGFTTLD
jgi:hypothetical protein